MPLRIVRAVVAVTLLLASPRPPLSSDDAAALVARRHEPMAIISGRITDSATSQPLAGTTVSVRETTLGVQTDAQGNYRLNVPVDSAKGRDIVMVVRRIGYHPATRALHVVAGPRTEHFALVATQVQP